MSYAGERRIIDADSHVIELDDFVAAFATDDELAALPPMDAQDVLPVVPEGLERGRELFEKRSADPALMARFEASLLDTSKNGWSRLGAFDPRSGRTAWSCSASSSSSSCRRSPSTRSDTSPTRPCWPRAPER